jgi:hypothetical protein
MTGEGGALISKVEVAFVLMFDSWLMSSTSTSSSVFSDDLVHVLVTINSSPVY